MAKILVIEDDTSILEGVVEVLILEDYDVLGASDGEQGVEMAQSFQPDLVICDIMMPRMNGYAVLQEIRKMSSLSLVPFIFLTAKATRDDMRYGMDLGADDYLTKPFKSHELIKMVSSRLAIHQAREREMTRQMDQLRGSVSHSLPHELRTPLTNMLGNLGLVLEDFETMDRDTVKEMLTAAHRAGKRLYETVEKYMLYARLELLRSDPALRMELTSAIVEDAKAVIYDAATARAYSYGRPMDLELDVPDDLILRISSGDLQKIISELVDNAFKFSVAGATVQVVGEIKDKRFILHVRNEGRGMTLEEIQRVSALVQFQRDVYEQKGVGLGLSIARGLTELYGGSLRIDSDPGKKTCVDIELLLAS